MTSAFSAFKHLSSPRHFLIAPTFYSQDSIAYSNHVQDIHSLREYREPGEYTTPTLRVCGLTRRDRVDPSSGAFLRTRNCPRHILSELLPGILRSPLAQS
jgi:hypothetical protein